MSMLRGVAKVLSSGLFSNEDRWLLHRPLLPCNPSPCPWEWIRGATRPSRATSSPLSRRLSAAHVNPRVAELSSVMHVDKTRSGWVRI